ncbi:hypothetical protein O4G98_13635 [Zoogloeaceae bacterium G21618-S1]|nr:hypothetical protein [Zoogloeaceae bacterium G21618-S1]
MTNRFRFAFRVLFVFAVGVATGVAGNWLHFRSTMTSIAGVGVDVYSSALYVYEFEEAERQYANPNRDVAIYALSRATRKLEEFSPPRHLGCRQVAFGMAKLNVRLASLYGAEGDKAAENAHLRSAMLYYQKMGWTLESPEELKTVLPFINDGKLVEAVKRAGRSATPCE